MTDTTPKAAEVVVTTEHVFNTPQGTVVIPANALAQPTQMRRPWRATARSTFQALIGLAVIAPLVAAAAEEATGYDLDGVPFVAAVLAGAAGVARVMALPAVEVWLRRFLPFLAAAPKA